MGGLEALVNLLKSALGVFGDPHGSLIGTWMLAWVFAWSGLAKLRRPRRAALAIVEFGVTSRTNPLFGFGLGAIEVALAAALVLWPSRRPALAAVMMTLSVFLVLIVRSLARGELFPCYCFGNDASVISWMTAVRTAGLTAVALLLFANWTIALRDPWLEANAAMGAAGTLLILILVTKLPALWNWNREVVSHFRNLSDYEPLRPSHFVHISGDRYDHA
jgi:hypothetical protein